MVLIGFNPTKYPSRGYRPPRGAAPQGGMPDINLMQPVEDFFNHVEMNYDFVEHEKITALRSLKVYVTTGKSGSINVITAGDLGQDEVLDMQAGVSPAIIDFGDEDLYKDPKKWTKKQILATAKSLGFPVDARGKFDINLGDVDTKNLKGAFAKMIEGKMPDDEVMGLSGVIKRRAAGDMDLKYSGDDSPIRLTGRGVYQRGNYVLGVGADDRGKDLYKIAGDSFVKFVEESKSGLTRDGSYKGFLKDGFNALNEDVQQTIKGMTVQGIVVDDSKLVVANGLRARTNVINKMEGVGKGINGASDAIDAHIYAIGFRDYKDVKDTSGAVIKTAAQAKLEAETAIKQAYDNLYRIETRDKLDALGNIIGTEDVETGILGDAKTALEKAKAEARTYVEKDASGNVIRSVTRNDLGSEFDAEVLRYQQYLDKSIAQVTQLKTQNLASTAGLMEAKSRLNMLNGDFTGGGPLKGVQDQYMHTVARRHLINDHSDLRVNWIDIDMSNGMGGTKPVLSGGRQFARVTQIGHNIHEREEYKDIVQNYENGKLFSTYIYPKYFRGRVLVLTPAWWISDAVKRTHGFGLMYNEKYEEKALAPFKALTNTKAYQNNFNINYTTGFGTQRVKFQGDKSIAFGLTIAKQKNKVDPANNPLIPIMQDQTNYIRVINSESIKGLEIDLGKQTSAEFLRDYMTNSAKYRAWLQKVNADNGLGLTFVNGKLEDTAENFAKVSELNKSLNKYEVNPDNLSILIAKSSPMQKLVARLNKVQTWYYGKVQKFVQPLTYIKTVLAGFFAKGIMAGLNTLTGGAVSTLSVFTLGLVERVVKVVANKIVNVGESFAQALFKGDFSGLTKEINKFLETSFKALFMAVTIPCGCMAIFVAVIFGMFAVQANGTPPASAARSLTISEYGALWTDANPTAEPQDDNTAIGSCPIQTYMVRTCSFGHGAGWGTFVPEGGHGTYHYWSSYCGTTTANACFCQWSLPGHWIAGGGANGNNTYCTANSEIGDTYGFSADIEEDNYPANSGSTIPVYLPELDNVQEWNVDFVRSSTLGWVVKVHGTGDTGDYELILLHVFDVSSAITPGAVAHPHEYVGVLWDGWPGRTGNRNRHLHIELSIDGSPVRPENHLCNPNRCVTP